MTATTTATTFPTTTATTMTTTMETPENWRPLHNRRSNPGFRVVSTQTSPCSPGLPCRGGGGVWWLVGGGGRGEGGRRCAGLLLRPVALLRAGRAPGRTHQRDHRRACRGRAEVLGGHGVRVPFRGRRLKRWQRRHNSTHAKIRCLGEQAMATLKSWRLLRKLRCSTNRITAIVQAILVLHHASA